VRAGGPVRVDTLKVIAYSVSRQRVWAIGPNFAVLRTWLVSGRYGNPRPGTYVVFSKSPWSFAAANPAVRWQWMVRFVKSKTGAHIGFHQIPVRCRDDRCVPVQSEAELGQPRSSGCVRQRASDAKWLYDWAPVGTMVLVTP
jgi:lipoprotein-anchoring transpeptidase ErfK/SrfK